MGFRRGWLLGGAGIVLSFVCCNAREFGCLLNTAQLVLLVELFTLPPALLLAFYLTRTNGWARFPLLLSLGSLTLVPLYLQLCGWDAAFGILGWFTLATANRSAPLLAGFRAAVAIHTLYAIPWATLLMAAAFRAGHRVWEEQAMLEGSKYQVVLRVTWPQLRGGLLLAAVWVFAITAGEMTVTNIYLVRTYTENIYSAFAASGDLEAVVPQALPLIGFIAGVVLLGYGSLANLPANPWEDAAYRWPLRSSRALWSGFAVAFVGALVLFPCANLVAQAGLQVRWVDDHATRIWSVEKLWAILSHTPGKFQTEFITTAQLGLAVAALAMPLGGGLAWWTHRGKFGSACLWFLAAAGLALPAPLVGLAVIQLLNQPQFPLFNWLYDRTLVPPILAILARSGPLAFAGSWWAWRSLAIEPFEAAALEGASAWQRFMLIALPQRGKMLALLTMIIVAQAAGDLSAGILTLPPGVSTIPFRMFGMVHSGVNDQVAGLGLLTWSLYVIAALGLGGCLSNGGRKNGSSR